MRLKKLRHQDSNVETSSIVRWVHNPLTIRDVYSILTERKPFDSSLVYRVMVQSSPVADEDPPVYTDVQIARTVTTHKRSHQRTQVPLFYVGSEETLDRYLRWLHREKLVTEYGSPRRLFVVLQFTHEAQSQVISFFDEDLPVFVCPGSEILLDTMVQHKHGQLLLF